jgi:hypothetical protein
MAMPMTTALRRPWEALFVRRAMMLTGLAAGLWLAGSAGSSAAAEETAPQPLTPIVAPVQDLAGGLLAPVTGALTPVVAPVVETAVAPVAQTVGETLTPVVRAVEPVTAPVVAVLSPVLTPVVESVVTPVRPVVEPGLPPVAVPLPVPAAVAEPVAAVVDSPSVVDAPALVPTVAIADPPAASVPAAAASGARTGVVAQATGDLTPVPAPVPGGNHLPTPRPAVPSGAPAVASGPSSPDQPAADLPAAAASGVLAALYAAADDARNAAADRALDPTFAPD